MKDLMNKSTWDRPYTMQSWGSLIAALFCSAVFFAAYGGTSWWVQYYPRPDGQIATDAISFGLFRMCIRGDCVIDMTNRHLIKYFLPAELQDQALHQLPASQWLMSFNVAFIIILFFIYLGFLAGARTYYAEVWLQFIICILILVSVAIFGAKFQGSQANLPFGWSFWLAVVAGILFLMNGIVVAFISNIVHKKDQMSPMKLYIQES